MQCILKTGRVIVNETETPTQDVTADDVASCKSLDNLPQYKIDKQRFASVLRDPVQNSLLTVATVALPMGHVNERDLGSTDPTSAQSAH